MELTGIISVAAILIAVFALMWQMNTQGNKLRDELMEAIRENREAIRENREAIRENRDAIRENQVAIRENRDAIRENRDAIHANRDAIQSLDGRLVDVERGQARLEEFNGRLRVCLINDEQTGILLI